MTLRKSSLTVNGRISAIPPIFLNLQILDLPRWFHQPLAKPPGLQTAWRRLPTFRSDMHCQPRLSIPNLGLPEHGEPNSMPRVAGADLSILMDRPVAITIRLNLCRR